MTDRYQICKTLIDGRQCAFYCEHCGCDIHNRPENCAKQEALRKETSNG